MKIAAPRPRDPREPPPPREPLLAGPVAAQLRRGGIVVLAYALWVAVGGAGVVTILLGRSVALNLSVALRTGPYALGLLDKVTLAVLGLTWMIWMIYAEHALRGAAGRGLRAVLATAARTGGAVAAALASLAVTAVALTLLG